MLHVTWLFGAPVQNVMANSSKVIVTPSPLPSPFLLRLRVVLVLISAMKQSWYKLLWWLILALVWEHYGCLFLRSLELFSQGKLLHFARQLKPCSGKDFAPLPILPFCLKCSPSWSSNVFVCQFMTESVLFQSQFVHSHHRESCNELYHRFTRGGQWMGGRYVAAITQIIIRTNIIISDNAPVVEIMSESQAD